MENQILMGSPISKKMEKGIPVISSSSLIMASLKLYFIILINNIIYSNWGASRLVFKVKTTLRPIDLL